MRFRYSLQAMIAAPPLNVLAPVHAHARAERANHACASNPVRAFASASMNVLPREQSAT